MNYDIEEHLWKQSQLQFLLWQSSISAFRPRVWLKLATIPCTFVGPVCYSTRRNMTSHSAQMLFARRRPLLPSFLSFVTVTKVLWYFNVMLFSCRYHICMRLSSRTIWGECSLWSNQCLNIFFQPRMGCYSWDFRSDSSIYLNHIHE